MFTHSVRVRFSECDGLGHVNNTTYFNYMEDARLDVFRIFNPALELPKWNLIVASTRCDFLAQVTYAQELTIESWISKVGSSSLVVDHAVRNASQTVVARGQAVLILYDYELQQSKPIEDDVRVTLREHSTGPSDVPPLRS